MDEFPGKARIKAGSLDHEMSQLPVLLRTSGNMSGEWVMVLKQNP